MEESFKKKYSEIRKLYFSASKIPIKKV